MEESLHVPEALHDLFRMPSLFRKGFGGDDPEQHAQEAQARPERAEAHRVADLRHDDEVRQHDADLEDLDRPRLSARCIYSDAHTVCARAPNTL